jgi:CRISPR system Cascade subunit CasA
MAAHRIDEKHGRLARKFRSSNIWRDFDSLMPDGSDLAPRVLETTRIVLEFVDEAIFRAVLVIGALSDKAKVVFWRRQTFTLPPFLLSSPEARSLVSEGLRLADDFGRGLYLALSRYYRSVLRHGEAEPRKEDVTALITSSSVLSSFWSVLEVRFPLFLEMIASRTAFDSSRAFWNESVLTAFELAWSTLSDAGEERNPWTIRALVRAEKDLNIKRRELYNAIKQFSSNG